jgi:hypothetical protein
LEAWILLYTAVEAINFALHPDGSNWILLYTLDGSSHAVYSVEQLLYTCGGGNWNCSICIFSHISITESARRDDIEPNLMLFLASVELLHQKKEPKTLVFIKVEWKNWKTILRN